MHLYFSQQFEVDPKVLEQYGAFDISVASDLPLFVDPFLLFNSRQKAYQELHEGIIEYLLFLRDKADSGIDPGLLAAWYRFKEVKQNWLGFTLLGNGGHALGVKFAATLYASLGSVLRGFGTEQITRSTHLEKLCLIGGGVGRDSISDFTTNLIKSYLLEYTQTFARKHLAAKHGHANLDVYESRDGPGWSVGGEEPQELRDKRRPSLRREFFQRLALQLGLELRIDPLHVAKKKERVRRRGFIDLEARGLTDYTGPLRRVA